LKKTKFLFLYSLSLIIVISADALSQNHFELSVGGPSHDYAESIIQTSDGGYAIAGYTFNFGAFDYDFYIVKLNANAVIQWSRTIGGLTREQAYKIIQTNDGGYAIAGHTYPFGQGSDEDMYIVKLDSNGEFQWHRTFGAIEGQERNRDFAYSIIQTNDGGYALAGYTWRFPLYLHIYFVKLDENGNYQWSRAIGGTSVDIARSLIQTSDGSYIIAGYSRTSNVDNFYIVKLNEQGSFQWNTAVGGPLDERAYSIIQSSDGGFVLAGETLSFSFGGAYQNMYIVKLDTTGTLQWTRVVGGSRSDRAYDIIQAPDGGYIAAGHTASHFSQSANRVYIVKLNSAGEFLMSKTVGGDWSESASSITQTTDGGFATAGFTLSYGTTPSVPDMYVLKFDSSGYTCDNSTPFGSQTSTGGNSFTPNPIIFAPVTIITEPTVIINSGGNVTSNCTVLGIENPHGGIPSSFELNQNYPNPFNPSTVISYSLPVNSDVTLKVFDILGKEVAVLFSGNQNAGEYNVEWNANEFSSGVYFYELRSRQTGSLSEEFKSVKRMLLIK
jgi:hypothetical protein